MPLNAATEAARLSTAPMMDGTGSLNFSVYSESFAGALMGHVVKNVVTFGRRFAGPLLYSDMRVLSPLYLSILWPLTKGDIAAIFLVIGPLSAASFGRGCTRSYVSFPGVVVRSN